MKWVALLLDCLISICVPSTAPRHWGKLNRAKKFFVFSSTSASVDGSLMYKGPICSVMALQTLRTMMDAEERDNPKAFVVSLICPSSARWYRVTAIYLSTLTGSHILVDWCSMCSVNRLHSVSKLCLDILKFSLHSSGTIWNKVVPPSACPSYPESSLPLPTKSGSSDNQTVWFANTLKVPHPQSQIFYFSKNQKGGI